MLSSDQDPQDPPPLTGSWNRLYAVVIGSLVLCILGFALFGWWFR